MAACFVPRWLWVASARATEDPTAAGAAPDGARPRAATADARRLWNGTHRPTGFPADPQRAWAEALMIVAGASASRFRKINRGSAPAVWEAWEGDLGV